MDAAGVYRSDQGKIWRVLEDEDGAIKVQVLEEGEWVPGRIGMVGLRLSDSTTRLTEEAIKELPE